MNGFLEVVAAIVIAFLVLNLGALISLANRVDEITETQRRFNDKKNKFKR